MKLYPVVRALLARLLALVCLAAAGLVLLFFLPNRAPTTSPLRAAVKRVETSVRASPLVSAIANRECSAEGAMAPAAADNATSINTAAVSPFGAPEIGWETYAPLIAHEIATTCPPKTTGFATAVAVWQKAHNTATTGRVDGPTLSALAMTWLLRRPFVLAMKMGCPPSPSEQTLAQAAPSEAWGGKTLLARPGALNAYRRMSAAARADIGVVAPLLTLASAYRGPIEEAARCADGSCGNPRKANCSAHRTGLAFDFYLGAAPGRDAFSTTNDNRLFQSQGPTYRWLVNNAGRFGFVPYPFEPWHWEWTGEAV